MRLASLLAPAFLLPVALVAQAHSPGDMAGTPHAPSQPSKSLTLAGLQGETRTLSLADLKSMPHVSVTVINGHSPKQETYTGVTVHDLLATVTAPNSANFGPVAMNAPAMLKSSPRLTVILAEGTDHYRIALTLCDTDPACRSGQTIVADTLDGHPLTTDGAFKLILTEDKTPGRWVRNLSTLTEKNLGAM